MYSEAHSGPCQISKTRVFCENSFLLKHCWLILQKVLRYIFGVVFNAHPSALVSNPIWKSRNRSYLVKEKFSERKILQALTNRYNKLFWISFQKLFLNIFKGLSPIEMRLINTSYWDHIWWTWFHVTFFKCSL